ncbi:MAG: hypothetical protein JRN52_09770 [Nitrososphaerota archaeon]|nr:hypothetical protein [Nitrososphaerota archaeon]
MAAHKVLELIGGILLIVLGLLFIAYLGTSPTELATDVIFVGAGMLVIRRALQRRSSPVAQSQTARKESHR